MTATTRASHAPKLIPPGAEYHRMFAGASSCRCQAAGEEYGFRGPVLRDAASWGRGRSAQLLLGLAVASVLFALIHADRARFDRSAGSVGAALLTPSCLVLVAAAVVVRIRTRDSGPPRGVS